MDRGGRGVPRTSTDVLGTQCANGSSVVGPLVSGSSVVFLKCPLLPSILNTFEYGNPRFCLDLMLSAQ